MTTLKKIPKTAIGPYPKDICYQLMILHVEFDESKI